MKTTDELTDYAGIEIHAEESSSYEPAPSGSHIARCVSMIELGTLQGYKEGDKPRRKLIIGFELPHDKKVFDESKGEQPFFIQNVYSLVINEKSNFTKHFEGWTGGRINSDFNPFTMLGKPATLAITHKPSANDPSKIKARITGITPLMKGIECPQRINNLKVLAFQRWDQELFASLSEWIRKQIESSPEYKQMMSGKPIAEGNKEGQWQKKPAPEKKDNEVTDLPF